MVVHEERSVRLGCLRIAFSFRGCLAYRAILLARRILPKYPSCEGWCERIVERRRRRPFWDLSVSLVGRLCESLRITNGLFTFCMFASGFLDRSRLKGSVSIDVKHTFLPIKDKMLDQRCETNWNIESRCLTFSGSVMLPRYKFVVKISSVILTNIIQQNAHLLNTHTGCEDIWKSLLNGRIYFEINRFITNPIHVSRYNNDQILTLPHDAWLWG